MHLDSRKSRQYFVFLRAVNVSGKNIIKMAVLKSILIQNGFQNVTTYIQSGNIIFESPLQKNEVLLQIRQLVLDNFNLSISLFIYTKEELIKILENNPFKEPLEGNKVFITFLENEMNSETSKDIQEIKFENEFFKIMDDIFYSFLPDGMAKSKLNNSFLEKKLKMKTTGRNRNTIEKMLLLTT